MPSPAERKHPPRVTIELGVKGLVAPEVVGYQFYDFPHGTYEYVPLSEFEEIRKRLEEAVELARKLTWYAECLTLRIPDRSQINYTTLNEARAYFAKKPATEGK